MRIITIFCTTHLRRIGLFTPRFLSRSVAIHSALSRTVRRSTADWKDTKGTYDDPSSPFYHAIRTDTPSSLYGGVGPKTPENARTLLGWLSAPGSPVPSPAVGALRRGAVEGALKTTNDGSPNFKTCGTQLNRIPADYRSELFSPDQNSRLFDIANTSSLRANNLYSPPPVRAPENDYSSTYKQERGANDFSDCDAFVRLIAGRNNGQGNRQHRCYQAD